MTVGEGQTVRPACILCATQAYKSNWGLSHHTTGLSLADIVAAEGGATGVAPPVLREELAQIIHMNK